MTAPIKSRVHHIEYIFGIEVRYTWERVSKAKIALGWQLTFKGIEYSDWVIVVNTTDPKEAFKVLEYQVRRVIIKDLPRL